MSLHWRLLAILAGVALHSPLLASSVPFWGAHASRPIDTPVDKLRPGEFIWIGDAVSAGPMVMVVSLSEQRAYVYRNGVAIGVTTVSTGRRGYETPTGVFTILQKQKEHRSTIYDGAPMPYMERLTWGGVALHAGGLPGYPESHGCVHLPSEFARLLFQVSPDGMTVVIANDRTEPQQVAHPGYLAPVAYIGGQPIHDLPLAPAEDARWQPQLSPAGPVSIVLSQASHRVVVYRNGIEIGRARLVVSGDEPLPTHVLILQEGPSSVPDPYVPDATRYRWIRIGVPGQADAAGAQADAQAIARIRLPVEFVRELDSILAPGATVVVTGEPLLPGSARMPLQVVDADPPHAPHRS
ncbi:MAG TPA: L,D-transpeptidase [Steroidobacteraceae bacterium]|nr:L,D-transpeptidase [Steroidobacteraceae bacterium]